MHFSRWERPLSRARDRSSSITIYTIYVDNKINPRIVLRREDCGRSSRSRPQTWERSVCPVCSIQDLPDSRLVVREDLLPGRANFFARGVPQILGLSGKNADSP